jgi:hypothetical protein
MNPALIGAEQAFEGFLSTFSDRWRAPALARASRHIDHVTGTCMLELRFEGVPAPLQTVMNLLLFEAWPWPGIGEFFDLYERMRGPRVTRDPLEIVNLAITHINPPPIDIGVSSRANDASADERQRNLRRRREFEQYEMRINPPLVVGDTLTATEVGEAELYVRRALPPAARCSLNFLSPAPEDPAIAKAAALKSRRLLSSWLTVRQKAELKRFGYFHVIGGTSGTRYRIFPGTVQNVFVLNDKGTRRHGLCFAPKGNLPVGDVMLSQKLSLELQEDEALAKANVFVSMREWGLSSVPLPPIAWQRRNAAAVVIVGLEADHYPVARR